MTGLSVVTGADKGLRIRKPSSILTNIAELSMPFENLRCNNRHSHLNIIGNSRHLKQAEVWTWDEASRVFEGIKLLLKAIRSGRTTEKVFSVLYPTKSLKPKERIIPNATPGEPQKDMTTEHLQDTNHLAVAAVTVEQ